MWEGHGTPALSMRCTFAGVYRSVVGTEYELGVYSYGGGGSGGRGGHIVVYAGSVHSCWGVKNVIWCVERII